MDSIFSPRLFETAASAGEDLEYTAAYSEFIALSMPREERQIGAHVIPMQAPNWSEVLGKGVTLLGRSRDLRILGKTCQAALQKHGLPGLAQGLALMAQWVGNEWDHLYPLLNADGDYDPIFRSNAVAEIADREGLVQTLRQAAFLETPIGAVSVSVAEHLIEGKPAEKAIIASLEQLARILIEEKERNQERIAALTSIAASLETIESTFKARLESEYWPNIELLRKIITRIEGFVTGQLQETEKPAQAPAMTTGKHEAGGSLASVSTAALPGAVGTRAEASRALALAREYFEQHEPSHPAPLLIRRIERIVDSDFAAIVSELMPEALQQLHTLAGMAAGDVES